MTDDDSLAEAIEACEVIERELAVRAARRRSATDVAAVREALDALRTAAGNPRAFVEHDLVLRRRIAACSGCRYLARVLDAILLALLPALMDVAERDAGARRAVEQVELRVTLVEALARADGPAARRALDAILLPLRARAATASGTAGAVHRAPQAVCQTRPTPIR